MGMDKDGFKLRRERKGQVHSVLRTTQLSAREWVCGIICGIDVVEIESDEVRTQNGVRALDGKIDVKIRAVTLCHGADGTLVV